MKRKQSFPLTKAKRHCKDPPITYPIPQCLKLRFPWTLPLSEFCRKIEHQYSLSLYSTPSSSLLELMKDTLIVFPRDSNFFGTPPRLPVSNISLLQEETVTELLHKAIDLSLHLPNNSIQQKNVICYGFRSETDRSSENTFFSLKV